MQHSNKAPMDAVAIAAKIFCTQGLGFSKNFAIHNTIEG